MLLKGPSVQLDEGPFHFWGRDGGPEAGSGRGAGAARERPPAREASASSAETAPGGLCLRMRPTAAQMAASLGLEPHPEGGYYRETYRAAQTLRTPRGERPASTAILFLITAGSVSRLHRLASDELWVYQGGLQLELVTITTGGELDRRVLGDPVDIGRRLGREHLPTEDVPAGAPDGPPEGSQGLLLQALVPAGSWQGARLAGGPHLPADTRLGAGELRRDARLRLRGLRAGRSRRAAGVVSAACEPRPGADLSLGGPVRTT